ncbi:hypothetical protein FB451DRAFT_1384470 [Mycena latifolia]|nr:hypothetical protein FB451DRAFT_1384470 [Mycena latifolia]
MPTSLPPSLPTSALPIAFPASSSLHPHRVDVSRSSVIDISPFPLIDVSPYPHPTSLPSTPPTSLHSDDPSMSLPSIHRSPFRRSFPALQHSLSLTPTTSPSTPRKLPKSPFLVIYVSPCQWVSLPLYSVSESPTRLSTSPLSSVSLAHPSCRFQPVSLTDLASFHPIGSPPSPPASSSLLLPQYKRLSLPHLSSPFGHPLA